MGPRGGAGGKPAPQHFHLGFFKKGPPTKKTMRNGPEISLANKKNHGVEQVLGRSFDSSNSLLMNLEKRAEGWNENITKILRVNYRDSKNYP